MNNIWFSSDYHFNHKNIIKYENRPFKNVEEMNRVIIQKHNERVKEKDIVYFLGDWGFYASKNKAFRGEGLPNRVKKLKDKMKGNFVSIRGNHDKLSNKINIANHRVILNKGGIYINLVHRPTDTIISDEQYYYPLTLCGHVHGKWKTKEIENNKIALVVNVSVETNNYYPYSFDEIMVIYWKWLNKHPRKKEILKWIEQSKYKQPFIKLKDIK